MLYLKCEYMKQVCDVRHVVVRIFFLFLSTGKFLRRTIIHRENTSFSVHSWTDLNSFWNGVKIESSRCTNAESVWWWNRKWSREKTKQYSYNEIDRMRSHSVKSISEQNSKFLSALSPAWITTGGTYWQKLSCCSIE